MAKFKDRLKELRKDNNMTQKELAKKLDVPQGKISSWENGKLEPNLEMIDNLSNVFQVSVDYLIGKTRDKRTFLSIDEAKNLHPKSYKEIKDWFSKPYSGVGLDLTKIDFENAGIQIPVELSSKEKEELQKYRKNKGTENSLGTNSSKSSESKLNDL